MMVVTTVVSVEVLLVFGLLKSKCILVGAVFGASGCGRFVVVVVVVVESDDGGIDSG